ncbi:DNA repair protein [Trichinella spiralis]|uniref:DNA repair protein n=1 Tax=Trichinella spiralis TaxID=6334 RepID=A0ABR3KKR2_TRISP
MHKSAVLYSTLLHIFSGSPLLKVAISSSASFLHQTISTVFQTSLIHLMCQRDSHRDQQEETQLLFLRNLATNCPNRRLQPQFSIL